jgi:hypothetical protein
MSGTEQSDSPIVLRKLANKAARAVTEPVEGSGGTKRNAELQSTIRTRSWEVVSQAQGRIREAVTRNKKERFTALLHHVDVDCLGWVSRDNQDEGRIASSRNAPERAGHCLTRMLPWPDQLVNLGGSAKPAFLFDRQACFSVPTWPRRSRGAQRRGLGGAEPPAATRSAPFRASMARMASTGPSPE